ERPAMSFDNTLGYRQSQAASFFLRPWCLPEPIKNSLQMFFRDAWTCVCHRYHYLLMLLTSRNSDHAFLGCELNRISDQVGNHLPNAMSIDGNMRQRWRQVDLKCLPLGFSLGSHAVDYWRYHVIQT